MTKLTQLKAVYDELAKKQLKVGFFEHSKYPDGTPIAYIAAIQELGYPAGGIPPRSFFRPTMSDKKAEYGQLIFRVAKAAAAGNISVTDGLTLVPHSVYVCVEGGDKNQIAQSLLRTKTLGAAFNGSEEVEVLEKISGQTYPVKFDRAKEIVLFCRVTVKKATVDAQTIIPKAVESWSNGDVEGDGGLVVGRDVSPFEISAGINTVESRLFITCVELSTDGKAWSSDNFTIKLNEVARIKGSAVQVVIV